MTELTAEATRPAPPFLATYAAQEERERRAYQWRNRVAVGVSVAGALGLWVAGGSGPLAWGAAAAAFLVNLVHATTTDWDEGWKAVWRRELPRLEARLGGYGVLDESVREARPDRGRRWWWRASWALAGAWLVALVLTIRASGLDLRLAR
jgi:hypothetical protein